MYMYLTNWRMSETTLDPCTGRNSHSCVRPLDQLGWPPFPACCTTVHVAGVHASHASHASHATLDMRPVPTGPPSLALCRGPSEPSDALVCQRCHPDSLRCAHTPQIRGNFLFATFHHLPWTWPPPLVSRALSPACAEASTLTLGMIILPPHQLPQCCTSRNKHGCVWFERHQMDRRSSLPQNLHTPSIGVFD